MSARTLPAIFALRAPEAVWTSNPTSLVAGTLIVFDNGGTERFRFVRAVARLKHAADYHPGASLGSREN